MAISRRDGRNMVDKSKMSVADILAAARKTGPEGQGPAKGSEPGAVPPKSQAADAEDERRAPVPAAKKPGGGRPSVADILAAARGRQQDTAVAPSPTETQVTSAAKPSSQRESPAETGPLDTQSILSTARGGAKRGPMTKAEAASKADPPLRDDKRQPAKSKAAEVIAVPPMPARPDYARPAGERAARDAAAERRSFIFGMSALAVGFFALGSTVSVWALATLRFMFPNILREPPSRFTVGFPDEFAPGQVETKFQAQYGVWIVNTEYEGEPQIVALKSVCTHLGCTPNWLEAEQKFKCPCHGSGFYKDGINFEGPAPRPLERYAISIGNDGKIQVDKSRTFQEELGQWSDPSCYIPV
jgi:cytochrome b6-f complex iron-sulfur subunit